MIYLDIKSITKQYDETAAHWVAKIPKSAQKLSAGLGCVTLPIIWGMLVVFSIVLHVIFTNTPWAIIGTLVLIFLPLSTVVKLFVRRARPQTIYTETMKIKTYSFPSSHAYSAALAGGYMAAMAYALLPDPWNGIVSLIVIAVIAAIGISRVHVGAHYPSDVTVGWMAGIAVLLVILYS